MKNPREIPIQEMLLDEILTQNASLETLRKTCTSLIPT